MTQLGKTHARTRLQDIANTLKVSASSVSLALGQETSGRVSSDLRARIVETAHAMNYVGRANGEFLYQHVAQSIGERIRKGELKCGKRLASIQAIHSLSPLKVPRDISILGFDDITWAAATYPRLTTLRVGKKLMGKLAVERVISLLEGERHKTASITITPELLKRESTAPPPRLQSDQCPPSRERAE